MSNKTKKRILSIALVAALLAILMAGGSLAWFTAEDSATNTFTVGSIEITQHEKEYERNDDGERTDELVDFDDSEGNKVLLPVVNTDNPYADPSYQDKIVTIENTGKNDAYVRTHIAIPSALVGYLHLDVIHSTNGWTPVEYQEGENVVTVNGMEYTVYSYEYQKKLTGEEPVTPVLLQGVYMEARVDVQMNEATGNREFCYRDANGEFTFSGFPVENATKIDVLVVSQAVQADGFTNAQEALSNAFGTAMPDFSQVKA